MPLASRSLSGALNLPRAGLVGHCVEGLGVEAATAIFLDAFGDCIRRAHRQPGDQVMTPGEKLITIRGGAVVSE